MKNIKYILSLTVLFASVLFTDAQTINWAGLKNEQKHIINFNVSSEYALNYGVAYGYRLKSKLPIVLNAEYSFPSGENILDDFKSKLGGQIRWLQTGSFQFSTKIQGIFRRYETGYARLINFGSDFSGIAGFYKRKWFLAGEAGFDKAIVTNFKHSDLYKENYPGVSDGWYEPPCGGNFYFDVQAGYSTNKFDFYVKAGQIVEQDLKTSPIMPIYAQAGINLKF